MAVSELAGEVTASGKRWELDELDATFITDEELVAMELRANNAAGGPWKSYVEGREEISGSSFIMTSKEDLYLSGGTSADQDFIAMARTDIPRLIQEIRRLRLSL